MLEAVEGAKGWGLVTKRELKRNETRRKIIEAAHGLFAVRGYKDTTIRQITAEAGVNIGTLYHYFQDKEGIFLRVVESAYADLLDVTNVFSLADGGRLLQYALTRVVEFKVAEKHDIYADILQAYYNSWRISERVLPYDIGNLKYFFAEFTGGLDDGQFGVMALALRGMRANFIAQRIFQGRDSFRASWPLFLEAEMLLFEVPREHITANIAKAIEVAGAHHFSIGGFEI